MGEGETLRAQGQRALEQHRPADAAALFEQAVALDAEDAAARRGLARAYAGVGRYFDAGQQLRAVMTPPFQADDLHTLVMILGKVDQLDQALSLSQAALAADPAHPIGYFLRGWVHNLRQEPAEALPWLHEAARRQQPFPQAWFEIAKSLVLLGRFEESLPYFHEMLRLDPNDALTHNNLGVAYYRMHDDARALHHLEASLRLKPGYAEPLSNRALLWLRQGDFERGWLDYEHRPSRRSEPDVPAWRGEPLAGKSIAILAEQGLGDFLHFLRYARLLQQRGGRVLLETPRPLVPLVRLAGGIDTIVPQGEGLPPHDWHVSLYSLPLVTGLMPAQTPYLRADAELANRWREELSRLPGFKIGIAWQGNPKMPFDCLRSLPLRAFAPLARLPGVTLVSLQKNHGLEQIAACAQDVPLVDLGPRLDERSGPFMDTAAVMQSLDLVVTPDSALAHLAGALAVPTWLLLSASADWRWLRQRDDSPWYPSFRLFRQSTRGDWDAVLARVARAVSDRGVNGRH
jgi:tetratricopeptide (TPR) repeat protein